MHVPSFVREFMFIRICRVFDIDAYDFGEHVDVGFSVGLTAAPGAVAEDDEGFGLERF